MNVFPLTPKPPNLTFVDLESSNKELDPLQGFVFGLVSPGAGVKDKIKEIEDLKKRKAENSPEADELSRKEKKILRDEEKRLKKLQKKQQSKGSKETQVSKSP